MIIALNESIQTRFRTIDGLSIRFAESEHRDDHALLLSPWPESLYAFEPIWSRLARHATMSEGRPHRAAASPPSLTQIGRTR